MAMHVDAVCQEQQAQTAPTLKDLSYAVNLPKQIT